MRVLYFHQHFTTPQGASGTRSYEFARALVRNGHRVTMVCGSYGTGRTGLEGAFKGGSRSGVVDGIDVIELELPYSNSDSFLTRTGTFLKFAVRSVWLALKRDYDLVFATSTPLTASIPGIFAKFLRRKPFVFEVRDLWPELPKAMGVISNPVILLFMGILESISYKAADHVIGLAPGIVDGVQKKSRDSLGTSLIPNGCDLDVFSPQVDQAAEIPGIDSGDFVAVFTGAHGIANGLDAVLDAAGELSMRQRADIKLLFIGHGMLKPKLLKRAKAENLSNCVFLDPVPKAELASMVQRADVGMMILANVEAFYYGTSPNKFFDYIASGMPVLCNYPGWVAEMLEEWQAGVAVQPDDPGAFADALEKMAADRPSRKNMSRNARALAEAKFDRGALAEKFIGVLTAVCDDQKAV